eukprot:1758694-Prymnesium_polylepis.1
MENRDSTETTAKAADGSASPPMAVPLWRSSPGRFSSGRCSERRSKASCPSRSSRDFEELEQANIAANVAAIASPSVSFASTTDETARVLQISKDSSPAPVRATPAGTPDGSPSRMRAPRRNSEENVMEDSPREMKTRYSGVLRTLLAAPTPMAS